MARGGLLDARPSGKGGRVGSRRTGLGPGRGVEHYYSERPKAVRGTLNAENEVRVLMRIVIELLVRVFVI